MNRRRAPSKVRKKPARKKPIQKKPAEKKKKKKAAKRPPRKNFAAKKAAPKKSIRKAAAKKTPRKKAARKATPADRAQNRRRPVPKKSRRTEPQEELARTGGGRPGERGRLGDSTPGLDSPRGAGRPGWVGARCLGLGRRPNRSIRPWRRCVRDSGDHRRREPSSRGHRRPSSGPTPNWFKRFRGFKRRHA